MGTGAQTAKQLLLPPTQMLPPHLAVSAHPANSDTVGTAAGEEDFAVDVMIISQLFSFALRLSNDIAVHRKKQVPGYLSVPQASPLSVEGHGPCVVALQQP